MTTIHTKSLAEEVTVLYMEIPQQIKQLNLFNSSLYLTHTHNKLLYIYII
jgi:hypothetical protein